MTRTAAERRHLARVAAHGCVLCRRLMGPDYEPGPAEIHHPREGQGAAQRASDCLSMGLCVEHHRGDSGFHGLGKSAFEARYGCTELDLLADVIRALYVR